MKKTRPKPYKIQKGRKSWKVQRGQGRIDLQPYKSVETYIKKKREKKKGESASEKVKMKRREKTNVFLPTIDPEIRGRRRLVHAS